MGESGYTKKDIFFKRHFKSVSDLVEGFSLKFYIVSVGELREKFLTAPLFEYEKRLQPYAELCHIVIREEKLPDRPSPEEIRLALEKEGALQCLKRCRTAYARIALCIEGDALSSEAFAARLDSMAARGCSAFAFMIGSSNGLSETVKKSADFKLSFSKMTFPHQLMQVILAEQLYRAMNLLHGGKYHK